MADNIISYIEMSQREALSFQAGMNYRLGENHSVILMSLRCNTPYRDRLQNDGSMLISRRRNRSSFIRTGRGAAQN